ncbi:helix-turn-helix domain-containing protein [Streptomyces albipurpureus]|uniref:Helix-turn-helix transcriptional regulator n=1 Tax=Streptomyces albipurpureus TaxID=2897419 RepID=A0ABT0UZC1_9ACTN|nr:helix-turn-helix transcriptional regulator [Streptomyces sp. CWNU-1]MCM2393621.1 helix-turn-helix transcriptional regulator [Streptomyces sp. CWNU-1]
MTTYKPQSMAVLREARQQMLDLTMSVEQIAGMLVLHHGLRPRAAFRHALGWTQEEAAEQINRHLPEHQALWSTHVSRYESWPTGGRKPAGRHLGAMARAYGTCVADLLDDLDRAELGEEQIGEVPREVGEGAAMRGRGADAGGVGAGERAGGSRTLDVLEDWDMLMRRRTLLAAGGTASAALLVPTLSGAALPEGPANAPVLEAWASLTDTYRRLDNLAGSASVVEQAGVHHRQLVDRWQVSSGADRVGLAGLVADSGALMGWLSVDRERYRQAGVYYRQVAEAAREAGDEGMYAYVVSRWSRVLAECGHHQDALRFADAACAAAVRAHPVVRSWTAVTRAYVHACLRDERACRQDLRSARALLDSAAGHGEPPPACVRFFDAAHLGKWVGYALMELGSVRWTPAARRALDTAAASWSREMVRGASEVSAACAAARIAQGEIEEAVVLTRQAFDVAARAGSPRSLRRVAEVRSQLAPYTDVRAVRELDDYLLSGVGSLPG